MKLEDFAKLTAKELGKMNVTQLRDLAKEQAKKLNKRLSNLRGNKEASHIAYNEAMQSGGKFGVKHIKKGTENEKTDLIYEIKRELRFQRSKSGTVRGAKEVKKNIQKATGKTAEEYSKEKGREYEKKEKERLKAKNKKHKLTKAQLKRIKKERAKREKEAKKQYNKAVGEAWDVFHRWREEHPNVSYSKEGVKASVNEFTVEKTNRKYTDMSDMQMNSALKDMFNLSVEKEPTVPDAWTTVNKDMQLPFI